MERRPVVVWTCPLWAGLVLAFSITAAKTVPRPPQLIRCVFHNRANVTCHWEAGDASATHYTLEVERIPAIAITSNRLLNTFTCTTPDTSCTAITNSSVRYVFCVTVTAHGHSWNVSSQPRCQSGRVEVMLPPVTLISVKPVEGRPQYLNVTWSRILSVFPVSDSEIKAGKLKSQIEFTAQGQSDVQVKEVTVTHYSFLACLFRPDTSYAIRLRHSYQGPKSPWSPWSNACQGRTGEDAPSAAPALWRRVKQTDGNGLRLVSLLWKPLPHFLANGRVLFFNVTCQTESAEVLKDHGTCRDVNNATTSCSLHLPAGRCSCALTASTSAGTSPEARIWLLGASETEPPSPSSVAAIALDDSSLDVRWTAPADRSTSGFVVEWFAVREKNSSDLHWEKLNSSCTALVITEGVKPLERYVVSVKALYGERGSGQNNTVQVYTREGVPSDGPEVQVQQISGGTVELIWSPVPVELLHGFIRSYTVSYSTANQPLRKVFVPGHVCRYSLKNLLPGHYAISMQANTDAGAGEAGPFANVHISEDSQEISLLLYALLPLLLTSLVLMACLAHSKMVRQKLCQDVPDPSNSSLAHWTPKITLEGRSTARSNSSPSRTDELKTLPPFLRQHQSPVSFSEFNSISHSSFLLSHPAEATSPQNTFSQSVSNSAPSLHPDIFSCPDALFATSPSTFPHSLFMDFSYSPLDSRGQYALESRA
uniref:interleukin-6 receptor subunit beta isoform X2 n=1 Tax=Scatophagus argus TaxID=75038 RepID=UPI001ED7D7B1|nr:interleukin-6 receptor subunit beta isoform X2 [Scatophagus argus]